MIDDLSEYSDLAIDNKHKESYNPNILGEIVEQDEGQETTRKMSVQKTDNLAEIW